MVCVCVCVCADVIDLTGDDKDDLQRAIALSLEESSRAFRETGITDEEQAISRCWRTMLLTCQHLFLHPLPPDNTSTDQHAYLSLKYHDTQTDTCTFSSLMLDLQHQ